MGGSAKSLFGLSGFFTTKQNNKNTKKYNTIKQITQIVGNSVREKYIKLERRVTSVVVGGKENQYIQAVHDFSQ